MQSLVPSQTRTQVLEDLIVTSHRLTRAAASATGSTTPEAVWRTLSVLTAQGPIRTGDLARVSRITQPGMTKLLREMLADELVYRIADVDDARAWLVAISPKGRDALEDWKLRLAAALEPMFGDLDDDEWELVARATALLRSRTQNAGTPRRGGVAADGRDAAIDEEDAA